MAATTTPPADAVLWQEQVALPDLPHPPGPVEGRVDVAVVGGGYAGLAAARVLAAAGRAVAVFEKGPLGWGAHSRNGGMAIPELKAGPATLRAKYGELGLRMHLEVNEAFDHLEALIATLESMDQRFGSYPWSTITVIHPPEDASGAAERVSLRRGLRTSSPAQLGQTF